MKRNLKRFFSYWFAEASLLWGILFLVQLLWVVLENIFDSGAQPSIADAVIGFILVLSIRKNLGWKIKFVEATHDC